MNATFLSERHSLLAHWLNLFIVQCPAHKPTKGEDARR
jgi:hypothetical protein